MLIWRVSQGAGSAGQSLEPVIWRFNNIVTAGCWIPEETEDRKVVNTVKVFDLTRVIGVREYSGGCHEACPDYDEAIKLLEFMVSDEVQAYYASEYEFPS